MLNILSITAPIYVLIALGFFAVRWNVFTKEDAGRLGKFVLILALPALLFRTLSQRSFAEIFDVAYLAAYGAGSLLVFFAAFYLARLRRKGDVSFRALYGMGMSFSNSGFVGYPILSQWLGEKASVALALGMLIENLILLPLMLVLAESGRDDGAGGWRMMLRSLGGLAANPMIVAIVAGFAFASLGIRLPVPVLRSVDMLADSSAPLSLFVIGGSLVGLKIQGMIRDIAEIALGKLILHPLAVVLILWLLPPIDPAFRAAAIGYASMPMLSIYPILGQKYQLEGFCAAALLLVTWLSFFTISALLWCLGEVSHLVV
ncbi:MAG: AEC family transporter [Thermodesulfobacteriota bacterium]